MFYPPALSDTQLARIHQTSVDILANIGVEFPLPAALDIFKQHGFRVDGQRVFFREQQIMDAVATVPRQIHLQARNPARNLSLGNGHSAFAPGYGAAFLIDPEQGRREATMDDYRQLVALAQELPSIDISGHLLVEPNDVPVEHAHVHMLLAHIEHSDKVFMGSTEGTVGARHSLDMARIVFGAAMDEAPVIIGLFDSLSPLSWATDMLAAMIEYAHAGQAVIITPGGIAGSTGPITIAGSLAMAHAEGLSAIVFTQLLHPGTPIFYGGPDMQMDMQTGGLAISSPEAVAKIRGKLQLAHMLGIPTRGGGALTDANAVGAQAGFESMLNLFISVEGGADLVVHSAGILSSFLAFSYEKMVLDDEIATMVRRSLQPVTVDDDALAYGVIAQVGPGGNFLLEDHTLERCRTEFWLPNLCDRNGLSAWMAGQTPDLMQRIRQRRQHLLDAHQPPPLDATVRRQLHAYVDAQA